jgi:hypothetical protein
MTTVDLGARIPNKTPPAARARGVAAQLRRLVEGDGPRGLPGRTTSSCARPSASTTRAGPLRLREDARLPLGHLPHRRRPDRTIGFGDHIGKPVWQQVPGEHRNALRRLIVTQGDTEPASVEQQRLLGQTCPSLYDLRNLFQVNVEEGRHLWAMVYLLHSYFGRDGREEAEEPARAPQRRRRQAAHPRGLQRAVADWLTSSCSRLHRPRRQVPAARARRERLRPARAHHALHAHRGGAPHVRRRDRRAARRPRSCRADEARPQRRRRAQGGIDLPD